MRDVVGLVPVLGRRPLVHQRLQGQSLIAAALQELAQVADDLVVWIDDVVPVELPAGVAVRVLPTDRSDELRELLGGSRVLVVHDPMCPLVPAAFIRQLALAALDGRAQVGVRPVVDTIKATEDDLVAGTVDRDGLRMVTSPLVLPSALAVAIAETLGDHPDLASLVRAVRAVAELDLVVAPSSSRRVSDLSDLRLMASVGAMSHRIRERD